MKKSLFAIAIAFVAVSAFAGSGEFVGEGVQSGVPAWDKALADAKPVQVSTVQPVIDSQGSAITTGTDGVGLTTES